MASETLFSLTRFTTQETDATQETFHRVIRKVIYLRKLSISFCAFFIGSITANINTGLP